MENLPYARKYLDQAGFLSAHPPDLQLPEGLLTWGAGSTQNGSVTGTTNLSVYFTLGDEPFTAALIPTQELQSMNGNRDFDGRCEICYFEVELTIGPVAAGMQDMLVCSFLSLLVVCDLVLMACYFQGNCNRVCPSHFKLSKCSCIT